MRKKFKFLMVLALEIAVLLCTSQMMAEMPYTTTKTNDCGQNVGAPKGRVGLRRIADPQGGWQTKGFIIDSFGPMPQTAYDPNYGCYSTPARTTNRYPAFHGTYYDHPYNYRNYAEYPWNAEMTEPRPYPNQMVQTCNQVILPSVVTPVEGGNSVQTVVEPETAAPAADEAGAEDEVPDLPMVPEEPTSGNTILKENISTKLDASILN